MKIQAFQTGSISESIVAFAQYVRSQGLNVGIQETQDALNAAVLGLMTDRAQFKQAMKALFCNTPEECMLYDQLFSLFWDTNPIDLKQQKSEVKIQGSVNRKTKASVVMLGQGHTTGQLDEDAKNVSGANATERLKKTDLSLLTQMEATQLEEIARKLCREMAARMRRRLRQHPRKGVPDLRRTVRHSISFGGEPMRLFHRMNTPKKQRLIVFLDISGSMDKYSLFLLRFICALRDHFRQLEAFVFSTSLKRISRGLQARHLETVLHNLRDHTDHWSGGTRIGECLQQFIEVYGKRMLNGSPTIIVLSDGLDTGDVSQLGTALAHMHARSKRIVWLNPLKGMKDYQPLARGMQAALPSIDDFRSAHNLESLLDLENILIHA